MATDLLERLRGVPGAAVALRALSGEARSWVVGGAVRDLLLGRSPAGILDLVVEGDAVAVARRAAARVGGRVVVHERFGTATVVLDGGGFDVASARRESYAAAGALPDVELGASLREDLARRDFTVNAIALGLDDGEVVAFPGALDDLGARRLRVLHGGSFVDDPTRLLRMVRYAARLGFSVEEDTAALASAAVRAGAVGTVSAARLGAELRLLLREPQPAALVGLEAYGGLGRAAVHPTFAADADRIARALAIWPAAPAASGPPGASASPAASASPGASGVPGASASSAGPGGALPPARLLALASCLAPAADVAARLDALEFTAAERDVVAAAVTRAPRLAAELARTPDDGALWRLARRERPEAIALAVVLDRTAEPAARRWLEDVRHRRLEITGDDLVAAGVTGPPVGRGLEAAMEALLDGSAPDRAAQLAAALAATPR